MSASVVKASCTVGLATTGGKRPRSLTLRSSLSLRFSRVIVRSSSRDRDTYASVAPALLHDTGPCPAREVVAWLAGNGHGYRLVRVPVLAMAPSGANQLPPLPPHQANRVPELSARFGAPAIIGSRSPAAACHPCDIVVRQHPRQRPAGRVARRGGSGERSRLAFGVETQAGPRSSTARRVRVLDGLILERATDPLRIGRADRHGEQFAAAVGSWAKSLFHDAEERDGANEGATRVERQGTNGRHDKPHAGFVDATSTGDPHGRLLASASLLRHRLSALRRRVRASRQRALLRLCSSEPYYRPRTGLRESSQATRTAAGRLSYGHLRTEHNPRCSAAPARRWRPRPLSIRREPLSIRRAAPKVDAVDRWQRHDRSRARSRAGARSRPTK